MIFTDIANAEPLDLAICGWTPQLQGKRKTLTPAEALAFETGAHQAAPSPLNAKPEPTLKQAKANRYARGHVEFQGLPITIECPRGSYRRGTAPDGTPWECRMPNHYGFVARTIGADGEGIDVFVGQDLDSDLVTIVNQIDPKTGAFDEHKVMLGFVSESDARDAYLAAYTPGWQGMGDTQACTMEDFKTWLECGELEEPARMIQKARFAEPNEDGTRWITIHPHGNKDAPGRAVRIRPVAGKSGVFHVVGGADGELNGLRLQNIKSPEHYKAEAKVRAKESRKAQKDKLAKMTPGQKEEHKANHEAAKTTVKEAEKKLIEASLKAKGIDPATAQMPEGSGLAGHKVHQSLVSDAMKTAREAEKRLLMDAEARVQAGIQSVGGDNQPSADDLLTTKSDEERGPGYVRALKERAKAAGLASDHLAEKVQELKRVSAENRVEDGKFTERHEKLGEGDAAAGILLAGKAQGDAAREAHMEAKGLKDAHQEAVRAQMTDAIAQNEALAEILKAKAELTAAKKAARSGKQEIFQKAYQANIEDLAGDIQQGVEDHFRTQRMMDFLDEVEANNPHSETVDPDAPSGEDSMQMSRHAGAWDALHEIGLGIMGQGFMDRDTVETLGPDASAVVAARAIRSVYTPDEQKEIIQALEAVHIEEQDGEQPKALEEAQNLRDEAKKVGDAIANDAHDLATAHLMQENKVALLKESRRILGSTLGRIEARAALIMALKEVPPESLTIPLGKIGNANAVMTAAALGLKADQHTLDSDSGEALLTLNKAGMDSLIKPVDQAAVSERDLAVAIKRGQLDETGYLLKGFARRTALTTDNPIEEPEALQQPMATLPHGADGKAIQEAMEDYVGLRLAEGHRPADVMAGMTSLTFMQEHFPGSEERADTVLRDAIFPLGEKAKTFNDLGNHLQGIATKAMERAGIDAAQTLDGQRLDLDHPDFAESLHQTLSVDPRLQAAFISTANLSSDQGKMLRDYFKAEIAPRMQGEDAPKEDKPADTTPPEKIGEPAKKLTFGKDTVEDAPDEDGYRRLALPKDTDKAKEIIQAEAGRMAGPEPEEFAASMLGDDEETPEHVEWKDRRDTHAEQLQKRARLKGNDEDAAKAADIEKEVQENLKAKNGGELTAEQQKATTASNHAARFESLWAEYVGKMGGLTQAQNAIQDHMGSKFLDTFKGHYERRTGQALRTSIVPVRGQKDFSTATGTYEERADDRSEKARQDIKLRKRQGGKLAAGSISEVREERHQQGEAAQASAGRFFDESETTPAPKGPKAPGHTERWSLGATAENQLRAVMPNAVKAMQGQTKGMTLKPIAMDGRHAPQQRAVKAIIQLHRIGLFAGAGSGKTSIMLGAHAELHTSGKVKKAIYAVPSAVQAQFGGEAAKFLDPKSGIQIHAKPGASFDERVNAYRDPETHGVVVTHQTLREDTMKVLGQHIGKNAEDTKAFVHAASREDLAQAVKEAWGKVGVSHDALMLDEGHNALNRQGKEDSTLAKIMDAIGDNSKYYVGATADPIKNDSSEAYDWLTKMDHSRYPASGRDEFLRRYGKNTATTRRALKAELSRYYFADRVDPSSKREDGTFTQKHDAIHTAPVTPKQKEALDSVDQAMARIRGTKTAADAAPYARVLSPNSFQEGMSPEDEAAAVDRVRSALGTMREGAYNRILNSDPEGGKVQATVALAKASHEAGQPPIVFARNHASVQAIQQQLEAQGMKVATLTGKHSSTEKADRIRKFQPQDGSEPEAHVLVMSDAGATGINLQRGQHVIQHDIPNTHMIHSQRSARAWRLGQTNDVQVTTVAADHAFDHRNLRRLKHKEGLASIFKSSEGSLDDSDTASTLREIRQRKAEAQCSAA